MKYYLINIACCFIIIFGLVGIVGCSSTPDIDITKQDIDNVRGDIAAYLFGSDMTADTYCMMDKFHNYLGDNGYKCLVWMQNVNRGKKNRYTVDQSKEINEFCKNIDFNIFNNRKLIINTAEECPK